LKGGVDMKRYTLYVGLADKDLKKQIISVKKAKSIINGEFAKNGIDGATFVGAEGVYTHENGQVITEKTFKIELLFTTYEKVCGAIKGIKAGLNQESIALATEEIQDSVLL
jgi:uncharacterized lipoprotein YmbA